MAQPTISLSPERALGISELPDFIYPDLFTFPSIHELSPTKGGEVDQRMLAYLKGGYNLSSFRGFDNDVLDASQRILGTFSIYTDGQWLWYKYMIYYYENYAIHLPKKFVDLVAERQYQPVFFDYERQEELSVQFNAKIYP